MRPSPPAQARAHGTASGGIKALLLDGSQRKGRVFLRQVRKGTAVPGWVREPVALLDAASPDGVRIATDGMLADAGLAGQPDAGLPPAGGGPLSGVPGSR